jgi:hypothetical protein
MTNSEFSNEFDVLYNNATSGQAPGLDEYEKSVFLTKAQDEIVKAYFNPKLNKTLEGFDASEKRQIDFSMIMRSAKYDNESITFQVGETDGLKPTSYTSLSTYTQVKNAVKSINNTNVMHSADFAKLNLSRLKLVKEENSQFPTYTVYSYCDSFFDYRDETKSIVVDHDILMFVNEYVVVERDGQKVRLVVEPVAYTEYSRLMSKPYKRPRKFQAWRILDNSATEDNVSEASKKVELVVGPNDVIQSYVIRYVKRPRAIRLTDFDNDVTLDGTYTEQSCELDPILHPDILQRAVEFAKATYTGDLNSIVSLGSASQTNATPITSSGTRER